MCRGVDTDVAEGVVAPGLRAGRGGDEDSAGDVDMVVGT